MKTIFPQTRFTGIVFTIILLLVLILGFFTVYTSYENEQRIVKRGFVTLKQNAVSITSRITSLSILERNKQKIPENLAYNTFIRNYSLIIDTAGKVEISNGIPLKIFKRKNAIFKDSSINTNDSLISSKAFFSDILDNTFFDEYIIFKDTTLFYKSFDTDPVLLTGNYLDNFKRNLYLPANYNIFKSKADSAIFSGGWNSGFISRIDLGYSKYYLFIYPLSVNNQHWFVGGMLTSEHYLLKKRHIEPWILILIGILLTFTLFSFQFVKLFLLSKTERVKTSDLVILCFSISGVGYIATLLILNFFSKEILQENSNAKLKDLNHVIEHSLTSELKLMYRAIESYEDVPHHWDHPAKPYLHILTSPDLRNLVKDTVAVRRIPFIKSLFLAFHGKSSEANRSLYMLSTWDVDASSRIGYRQYYQKKDEWLLPDTIGDLRFRLESVYSNTNGEVLAVLAKPSKYSADTIFGSASPLYSLMNTTLSPGFEFRIIGEDGKIWFHNNKHKNNQDNFLDECNQNKVLQEAIRNRVEVSVNVKISEKDYQCFISPIGKLPLYMVTLCNSREQDEFLSHVNYIFFVFILLGLFWGLVAAAVFYYEKIGKYTRGRKDEDIEPGIVWLLPDTHKNYRYMILFALNCCMAFLVCIPLFFKDITVLHMFCILFSASSICAVYIYLLLKTSRNKSIKISLPIAFSSIVIICNTVYYITLPDFLLFVTIEMLAVIIIGLIVFLVIRSIRLSPPNDPEKIISHKIPFIFNKLQNNILKHTRSPYLPYLCFIFSWVVATCVVPTCVLFKTAIREEVELTTRKNQIDLAKKTEQKNLEIDSFYIKHIYPLDNPAHQPYLDSIKNQLKQKGNYLLGLESISTGNDKKNLNDHQDYQSDSVFITLNCLIRQMIKKDDIRSVQMMYGTAHSPLWYWEGGYLSSPVSDTLTLHYASKQRNPDNLLSKVDLQIKSSLSAQKTNINSSWSKYSFQLILAFIVFLVMLFLLLKALLKNMFILKVPDDLNILSNLNSIHQFGNIFLVNSINQDYIKQLLPAYSIFSFENIPKDFTGKSILVNFNSIPVSDIIWLQAISALDEIVRLKQNHVVVISCYTPVQIKAALDEQILASTDKEVNSSLKETKRHLLQLFSLFTFYYYQNPDVVENLDSFIDKCVYRATNEAEKEELMDFLGHELKFAFGYIAKKERLYQVLCSQNSFQNLRLKLYQLFLPYYQYIWENCTINEKFILFDMSMDTMANPKNREGIRNLIGKGILDVEGKLDFVSQCFKRFVMELADTEEFITLEMSSKRTGGWSKLKGPLYFIFVILVVFVFFTQQDIISGLYGAIISIAGLLGALFKFGSLGKGSDDGDK